MLNLEDNLIFQSIAGLGFFVISNDDTVFLLIVV